MQAGASGVRATIWILVFLLTGCLGSDSDGDDGNDPPGDGSGAGTGGNGSAGGAGGAGSSDLVCAERGLPAILEVFNDTIAAASPGGAGEVVFDVSECYLELFITDVGDVVALGDIVLTLRSPSGNETALLDGVYIQQDEVGETSDMMACTPCEWRVNSEGGSWLLSWQVNGEMRLPLRVLAQ